MSVRAKTLRAIFLTAVVLAVVLYSASNILLTRSFDQLERDDATKNTDRARSALLQVIDAVNVKAADWSVWDDMCKFVQKPDPAFVQSNIPDSAYGSMKLNFIAIFNADGKLVYGQSYDEAAEKTGPLYPDLSEDMKPGSLILDRKSQTDKLSGVLMLSEGPAIIASHPIVRSDGKGPIKGTLVFGRLLSKDEIKLLSSTTRLSISAYRADMTADLPQICAANMAVLQAGQIHVEPMNANMISGACLLEDVYGNPGVVLNVTMPRSIHHKGSIAARYLVIALLASVALFVLMVIQVLDRLVLKPVTSLNGYAESTLRGLGLMQ